MIKHILILTAVLIIAIPLGTGAISDDTVKTKKTPQEVQIKTTKDKPSCIEKIQTQQKNIAQELAKIKNILKKQKSK